MPWTRWSRPWTAPLFPHHLAGQQLDALWHTGLNVATIHVVTDEHGATGVGCQLSGFEKIDFFGLHATVARGHQLQQRRPDVPAAGGKHIVITDKGRAGAVDGAEPTIAPELFSRLGVYSDQSRFHQLHILLDSRSVGNNHGSVAGPDATPLAVERERAAPPFRAGFLVEGDDPRLGAAGATD